MLAITTATKMSTRANTSNGHVPEVAARRGRGAAESAPEPERGPVVSIVSVTSTIGPAHLTYYKRVHGKRVAFSPRGVSVPERCPHGGFRFAASFGFQDGSSTSATTTVPCPPPLHRHHK